MCSLSAYKRFHSNETALLKIHNDIPCNMDSGKVTALTVLYKSAAFDTIDHSTLLERLHGHFGITGTVFQWFKSYISTRQQCVHIDGSLPCLQDLHFGVPHGSVLGHFLFCLYTTSISQMQVLSSTVTSASTNTFPICKSCFYHIRDLRRIRHHIHLSTAKTTSNALISSRLDYCNSLINNIAKQDLSKLCTYCTKGTSFRTITSLA